MIVDIADNFELTEWRGKRFWLMTADGSQAPQVDFLFRQQPVLLLHEIPTVFLAWNLLLGQSGAWQSSCCAFPKILHKLKWWMTLIVFWMIVSECTRVHYVGVGHPDRLKLCGYQLTVCNTMHWNDDDVILAFNGGGSFSDDNVGKVVAASLVDNVWENLMSLVFFCPRSEHLAVIGFRSHSPLRRMIIEDESVILINFLMSHICSVECYNCYISRWIKTFPGLLCRRLLRRTSNQRRRKISKKEKSRHWRDF